MIASCIAFTAIFLILFRETLTQEARYYWSDDVITTTTTTRLPDEQTTTSDSLSPDWEPELTMTSFDAKITPVFVVNSEVCNLANVVVFPLQSMGPKINYSIYKVTTGKKEFTIDSKERVILLDKVSFSGTEIHILAKNVDLSYRETSVADLDSADRIQYENFLVIRASISDSFCPGSQSTTTTIVIVSLSVLCIVFMSAFSLSLIALRRNKPFLFGMKQNSNQVGPGSVSRDQGWNSQNAQNENPDSSKSDFTVNSNLKPKKSSMKPSLRLPQVPQVSITCESLDSPSIPSPVAIFNETSNGTSDQAEGSTTDAGEVIVLNGMASPSLSVSDSSPEKRRPSTVTFNETTQIIQIARNKK